MWRNIFNFFKGFTESFKHQSTEYIEFELRELENAFAILILGSLIGLPSPPTPIALKILPHMQREIYVMQSRVSNDDIFGEILGLFDIG